MTVSRTVRILATGTLIALCLAADVSGAPRRARKSRKQPQSVENVRREQNRAQKVITETSKKLDRTTEELNRRMGQLNSRHRRPP